MPSEQAGTLDRRDFLKVLGTTGTGLVIGIHLSGCNDTSTETSDFHLYLRIDGNGEVTITAFRSEMGQGIRTAIAMIVADELDADWAGVRIEQAPADPDYGSQVTGGSKSISGSYSTLRGAGAVARHLLVTAAARRWDVDPRDCSTNEGWVIHPEAEERLSYGDLVEAASELEIPHLRDVRLKSEDRFRIMGTGRGHWDAPRIVTGKAVYGVDIRVPGMLYAAIARCPVFGGSVAGLDASRAEAVKAVRHVVEIDSGVAVVADHTWAAIQGRDALEVRWDEGRNADLTSVAIRKEIAAAAPELGSPRKDTLEAAYEIPYEAHATMEPMNCVADVRADRCEVWAPTQNPQKAKEEAMSITGLPANAVHVHVTLLGGGFGRRLKVDYVAEAVQISQAIAAPVQVMWTRDDDMRHDHYHPLSHHRVSARTDGSPADRTEQSFSADSFIPTGAWRSVGNFPEAYARECFLDEFAAATGKDPYELRLDLYPDRARGVTSLAATRAGWDSPLPEGWGRGIAYHATFGVTHVAMVAEVSVDDDGNVRVHRVVCAVDCGRVINPDTVAAQMEGGVAFGLTAALKAEITIANGRVQQSNFHDYPILRMDEMPVVEVHIVKSDEDPTGIGEMAVPPIVPAVANAIFAATGKRIRKVPIRAEDVRSG